MNGLDGYIDGWRKEFTSSSLYPTPPSLSMYLEPLCRHLKEMEECDFLELEQRFHPMFHIICLVWANSKHYCQPARLIVLLQEISNLVLDLVSS